MDFFLHLINIRGKGLHNHVKSLLKNEIVWVKTLYIAVEIRRCFGRTYRLHLHDRIESRARNICQPELLLAFKCQATDSSPWCIFPPGLLFSPACSSETSADFNRTTRRSNRKDNTFHAPRCVSNKSKLFFLVSFFLSLFPPHSLQRDAKH
jgi:hypothetical protein